MPLESGANLKETALNNADLTKANLTQTRMSFATERAGEPEIRRFKGG